jgi:hypothetical protein
MSYPPIILDLDKLPPGKMKAPRIIANTVGGGQSASGQFTGVDMSGGGLVALEYSDIQPGTATQSALRYWNRLAVATAGGIRPLIVPVMTDWMQPVTFVDPFGTPFDDDLSFSNNGDWTAPPAGLIADNSPVNGGTVNLTVLNGSRLLEGGEWFSINHATKSHRLYCVTDIDAGPVPVTGGNQYIVAIRPTLRQAITVGMDVTWWRPKCLMRLVEPMETDLEAYWHASLSMKLIEFSGNP